MAKIVDGIWEMSGPEEGDKIDRRVFVSCCDPDYDHYDIIEITKGTTSQRKRVAQRIANLLNKHDARMHARNDD